MNPSADAIHSVKPRNMKPLSSFLPIMVAAWLGAMPAYAASKSWQGDPFSALWRTPGNWDPPGVPQDGDELHFDHGGIPAQVMVNDLTNLTVKKLAFDGGAWVLNGNELGIQSLIANNRNGLVEIRCPARLEGTVTFVGY